MRGVCFAAACGLAICLVHGTALAQDARAPDQQQPPAPKGVVTKQPKLIQAVAPEYPKAALDAGKAADVKVRIHIDATGIVTSVDVIEKVGDGFDEAAVAAAEQYIFEPAEIDGVAAPIVVETEIHFVIETPPDEPDLPDVPPSSGDTPEASTNPPDHAGNMMLPVTIEGEVLEAGTRRKMAGAIVSIVELGLDVTTGEDGKFYFHGVTAGTYRILGVEDKSQRALRQITLEKHEKLELRLWMRPKDANPYQTVVEGERDVLEVTRRTLQRQQLSNVPGTFGDPIRVIQTMPGVQRAPFGLGLLLIRGSNPDDTGIYVDGHEVPSLFHFLGGPSIFNVEMLESIDLYPGGFPARFGRHHGGAVALELRPTKSDGVHGSAKVDFIDAGGYIRAPLTKDLSMAFAGRRSYIDAFLGFVLPAAPTGGTRIVTPVYYDFAGRLDYNLHNEGRLGLFVIGSSDSLRVVDSDPDSSVSTDLSTAIKFFRVIGNYTRQITDDLKLVISPAWGRDTATFTGAQAEAAGPFTSIAITNTSLSYRARVYGRPTPKVALDTGVDVLSRVTSYDALVPIDDNLINAQGVDIDPSRLFRGASTLGFGAYGDVGIDVSSRLKLIPSLRVDGYIIDGESKHSIDPRLVARYQVNKTFLAKAYLGEFSQPPQPEAVDRRFGNPNVGIEHAIHTGLGYEWKPDRLWSVDSEIYYVKRTDLVVFDDTVISNGDGTFTKVNFSNEGRRNSYGFEVLLKREISEHAFGWLSYTFSRSHQQQHPDEAWTTTGFDQPHVLNAVASWKPGRNFELGVRYQLSTGRPDTPVIGATYDADSGTYIPVKGDKNSIRQPLFTQLDVRAEKTWIYNTWTLGAYLDIINVTNNTNVEATQYDYRFKDSAPVTSFPFLPTLGVRGTW
ncbi:MAG TPA: TonB family protein [Kofleriaceae bacterium]|jgi:TonB family protein